MGFSRQMLMIWGQYGSRLCVSGLRHPTSPAKSPLLPWLRKAPAAPF